MSNHWLVKAAAAAGVVQPGQVKAEVGAPVGAVWEDLERASGMSEADLAERIAPKLRLRAARLEVNERATRIVPENLASEHNVLALADTNQRLIVATADPMDFAAEQKLGFVSGRMVEFELAGPRALERTIREAYTGDSVDALVAGLDDAIAHAVVAIDDDERGPSRNDINSKPVVKLTNLILSDAIHDRASDIHIQPIGNIGVVRCRVDGVMKTVMQLPLTGVTRVISRIKVLAQMDIADRVRPQDGRARLNIKGRDYDLRISTVPVSGGEKAVIRILAPASSTKIADIGLPAPELERVEKLLRLRDGVIAVTGPTGSGKTTTLYSALRQLATGETNIVTVEDPIEYRLAGVSQMQADPKRGVTFASALRAVLRQDPDVILIGEMRDSETAGIGVQAAMTGHLVLATLHTNDAVGAVPRLADLGVDRNSIADVLRGALAQRLLRRLCRACVQPAKGDYTDAEKRLNAQFGVEQPMVARGCPECGNSGYRGRVPVVEVMTITPQIQDLIVHGASSTELQKAAMAGGMRPMSVVAMDHVRAGLTSLEEVERVLGDAHDAPHDDVHATAGTAEPDDLDHRPHILIVDDDPLVRQLARFVLNTADYVIHEAENGRAALELLRTQPVSLVLLDLDMPELDGLATLKALRAERATLSLPVVVLTASDSSETSVMDAGADDYIRKPLDPERFLARIKAVLRRTMV